MAVLGRLSAASALLCLALIQPAPATGCGAKSTCGEMAGCAEALHYLTACGVYRLDADSDGIPCEALCGKDHETRDRRAGGQSRQGLVAPAYQCGTKRACANMDDCTEARFYLQACGLRSLDRDGDGVPCEGLCR